MKKLSLKTIEFAILAGAGLAFSAFAQDHDLAVLNGRVMDPEALLDAGANVGIKDDRITAITKDRIAGSESIEAKGLVVAPGFIDTRLPATDPFDQRIGAADKVPQPLGSASARFGDFAGPSVPDEVFCPIHGVLASRAVVASEAAVAPFTQQIALP